MTHTKDIHFVGPVWKNHRLEIKMKLIIKCEMGDRWVPHFIAMLKYMQQLGSMGASRKVALYADGDGDFHPKFKFRRKGFKKLPEVAKPIEDNNGNRLYDAG